MNSALKMYCTYVYKNIWKTLLIFAMVKYYFVQILTWLLYSVPRVEAVWDPPLKQTCGR